MIRTSGLRVAKRSGNEGAEAIERGYRLEETLSELGVYVVKGNSEISPLRR